MIGLAGCAGDSGSTADDDDDGTTYGTLSTAVTDQPSAIGDFESLTVTIDGIWIRPADGSDSESDDEETDESADTEMNETGSMNDSESMNESDEEMADEEMDDEEMDDEEMDDEEMEDEEMEDEEMDSDDSGRRYIEFEEPQDADLVQLQGSSTQLLGETEVAAHEYQFLQLDVADTVGVLTDGSDADVTTPGNAPLKFNTSFEVRTDEKTRFIADFAPNRTGNGRYIIRPVAASTTVLYGDEEYQGGNGGTTGGNETDGGSGGEANMTNGGSGGGNRSRGGS